MCLTYLNIFSLRELKFFQEIKSPIYMENRRLKIRLQNEGQDTDFVQVNLGRHVESVTKVPLRKYLWLPELICLVYLCSLCIDPW